MGNWKDTCNYRTRPGKDGKPTYIIYVDGVGIEVTKEVYFAYAKMERRERYILCDCAKKRKLSLEQLGEDGMDLEMLGAESIQSHECFLVECELEQERSAMLAKLKEIIPTLSPKERDLIRALYFEQISIREYARREGVYHRAIIYRRDRLLKKIRKILK